MVAPGIGAGLDRGEEVAALAIGEAAASSGEVRVERRIVLIFGMGIAAGAVRLPEFDVRVRDGGAVRI
jgi:hypothetical protein